MNKHRPTCTGYMHTHTHTQVHMHTHTHTHTHTSAYAHTHTSAYARSHIRARTHTHKHGFAHTCTFKSTPPARPPSKPPSKPPNPPPCPDLESCLLLLLLLLADNDCGFTKELGLGTPVVGGLVLPVPLLLVVLLVPSSPLSPVWPFRRTYITMPWRGSSGPSLPASSLAAGGVLLLTARVCARVCAWR